jgi:hypothetical protein
MLRRWFFQVVLMMAMSALGAGMATAADAPRIQDSRPCSGRRIRRSLTCVLLPIG